MPNQMRPLVKLFNHRPNSKIFQSNAYIFMELDRSLTKIRLIYATVAATYTQARAHTHTHATTAQTSQTKTLQTNLIYGSQIFGSIVLQVANGKRQMMIRSENSASNVPIRISLLLSLCVCAPLRQTKDKNDID